MKKMILIALAALPVMSQAQSAAYIVNGKLNKECKVTRAYLNYNAEGKNMLDSATIKDGAFNFKGTVAGPVRAIVLLDHAGAGLEKMGKNFDGLFFYLDKGTVSITTAKDSIKYGTVTGSAINTEYEKYKKFLAVPDLAISNINDEYNMAPAEKKKDEAFLTTLNERYGKAVKEKQDLQEKFVKANPNSFFSVIALQEMAAGEGADMAKIEAAYKTLSVANRNSADGKTLYKKINQERATAVGVLALDFTQNDVNDKPVKLSDFRGKYVLLDFWASWCGPCRQENPNVVKAYNTYKDKNFTVLSVSLDQAKDPWLAAIKKDGLTWTHVSDLKSWNNEVARQYGINSIPQNFLLDPSGKIIGKNLRGEDLEEKLKEVLK